MKLYIVCIVMVFIVPFLVMFALPRWIALSSVGDLIFFGLVAGGIFLCDELRLK